VFRLPVVPVRNCAAVSFPVKGGKNSMKYMNDMEQKKSGKMFFHFRVWGIISFNPKGNKPFIKIRLFPR